MDILICSPSEKAAENLERMLTDVRDARVVRRATTSHETIDVLRHQDIDLSIVDGNFLEVGLVARKQLSPEQIRSILWVAFLDRLSMPSVIKAAQYGYNDVLVAPTSSRELEHELVEIVENRRSVQTNPLLKSVDVVPGLYARQIIHSDRIDRDLVELLGLGLDDRDIGLALGLSVQEIRNRLATLLETNGLSNRTQLATLHIRSQLADWLA